jgi:virginiamycin A acetyltransferase
VSPDWVILGEHTYYAHRLGVGSWLPGEKIVIGQYCSIGDQVVLITGGNRHTDRAANYPVDILSFNQPTSTAIPRLPVGISPLMARRLGSIRAIIPLLIPGASYLSTKNTTLGNDVWVGYGAMILGGAQVGDGAVVAAGSVVFSDVPPYAIVAGNPAKVIRSRFSPAAIEKLLQIEWWHWPEEYVRANLEWFHRPISEFIERFDPSNAANPCNHSKSARTEVPS